VTAQTKVAGWVPPRTGSHFYRADGRYGWRAVTISQPLADSALLALGGNSGAVIADGLRGRLTWLIRSAEGLPDGTVVAPTSGIVVPPTTWVEFSRLYWLVPFRSGDFLTDGELLVAAIDAARGARS
jgi:hypothetical protein